MQIQMTIRIRESNNGELVPAFIPGHANLGFMALGTREDARMYKELTDVLEKNGFRLLPLEETDNPNVSKILTWSNEG